MLTRSHALLVLVAVSIFLVGCDNSVVQLRTEGGDPSVEVTLDQTIEVILEDNPRFDNTDWQWIVAEPGVVKLVSVDHVTRVEDDGVAGTWTLTFEPTQTGTADLVLVYRQPGQENTEPDFPGVASTFTATITAADEGDR